MSLSSPQGRLEPTVTTLNGVCHCGADVDDVVDSGGERVAGKSQDPSAGGEEVQRAHEEWQSHRYELSIIRPGVSLFAA